MTINGTAEGGNAVSTLFLTFTASGHKYLVRGKHIQIRKDNASFAITDDDYIFTSVVGSVYSFLFLVLNGTTVNETIFPQVSDLTLMFGESVANTMTVEMFEKLFPLSYYEHNPGEIISNEAVAIKGIGRNLWDEEWELGSFGGNGQPAWATDRIRSSNYIAVLPSTVYYRKSPVDIRICIYDESKAHIGFIDGGKNDTFTTPASARFIHFNTSAGATIYNHDICISLSGPLNGQYEPYKESIAKLDAKKIYGKLNGTGNYVQVFPDGIRSAGTAYDEVDYQSRSAVVRIGSEMLGNLDWNYHASISANDTNRFSASGLSIPAKNYPSSQVANILTWKYVTTSNVNTVNISGGSTRTGYISMCGSTCIIVINDTAYSDTATFKTAMQGVELLYELATPKYYTDLKLSDDNGATFHDLPRPFYYTAGLEMKDPQDTASSVTAPARILASYKPIKK